MKPPQPVTQEDREAAADVYRRFRYGTDRLQENVLGGRIDADPIVQAFARHRISASRPDTAVRATVARVLRESVAFSDDAQHLTAAQFIANRGDRIADAIAAALSLSTPATSDDPLYKAFRPRPETIAAIGRNEAANAAGLAAIRDMMVGHVTNWPEPRRFGTAISLIDKTLRAALSTPAAGELVEPRVAEEWSAYMDEAVSNAPEPLRKLGTYLADLLDEDQWKTAEQYLNAAALSPRPAGEERAWKSIDSAPKGLPSSDVGCRDASEWFEGLHKSGRVIEIHRRGWPNDDGWADRDECYYQPDRFTHWRPLARAILSPPKGEKADA
jgi:hypothetical protein